MRQEAAEALVVALDEGTTGVRAVLIDAAGTPRGEAYREVLPTFPAPGLVEHDPDLAGLVEAHTHILVGQAHGRSWLGSARASARLAGVS